MSLTPLHADPNYAKEMKRKQSEPETFGSDAVYDSMKIKPGAGAPEDGGLIPNFAKHETLKEWATQTVHDTIAGVAAKLPTATAEHIAALIAAETAGQARSTLLATLNAALLEKK